MEKERNPGTFGNRCRRCGSFLDEGGVCQCYDHEEGCPLMPDSAFYRKINSRVIKRICSICNGKPCICSVLKGTGISLS